MASILNRMRGVKAKTVTQSMAMPDAEYAAYLADVTSLPRKEQKKWKRHNELTDGTTVTVRFDGEFYTNWLNQRVVMYPISKVHEMKAAILRGKSKEHDGMMIQTDATDPLELHTFMDHAQADSATGNHGPRNHSIAVPTRAGEPVRG